jgi:molybdopterin biosynthesis enzyme MoaB
MITVAILTLSDKGAKGEREDASGTFIKDMLQGNGAEIQFYEHLPDEKALIKEKLLTYSRKLI